MDFLTWLRPLFRLTMDPLLDDWPRPFLRAAVFRVSIFLDLGEVRSMWSWVLLWEMPDVGLTGVGLRGGIFDNFLAVGI